MYFATWCQLLCEQSSKSHSSIPRVEYTLGQETFKVHGRESEIREIKIPPKKLFQLSREINNATKKPLKTRHGK